MRNIILFTKPSPKAKAIEKSLATELQKFSVQPQKPIVIAIGGDGTMLLAIKKHELKEVSYIGISAGHLGFLQTLKPEDISLLVDLSLIHIL